MPSGRIPKQQTILVCTNDKLELPVFVASTVRDACEWLGIQDCYYYKRLKKAGNNCVMAGYRVEVVP
jgi:hypothetical protein